MTSAPSARDSHTAVWTGSKMIVWGGDTNTGGVYDPATDTWTATSTVNAPSERADHTAVWTGSKMIVWGGFTGPGSDPTNTGGIYDPATDTWTSTSTLNAPSSRQSHTAVWTGSKMIVWGGWGGYDGPGWGLQDTGGIYDPATDAWTSTSTANAPSERSGHTAVWTGSKMVVWGGSYRFGPAIIGGIYDPATDTWTATSTTNAPSARASGYTVVWTGSKMIVWGGFGDSSFGLNTGGIYDPASDVWTATSTMNAPTPRYAHTAVWTGSEMIVWGGTYTWNDGTNTGGIYEPTTDAWTSTSTVNPPSSRQNHTAVWTGSKMIVWGGRDTYYSNTGAAYSNPAVLPPRPPPADFYTVMPCRVVDTRNAAGPTGGPALYAGATRAFPLTGGACGIPSTATAVSVNVTVVGAATRGYLTLYRGDVTDPPPTSDVNFSAGQTRANNAIVLLATNVGTVNVKNGSAGSVNLVVDVNGYFQ